MPLVLSLTEFMMREAEVIRTSDQIHSCVQGFQPMGCVTTCARQRGSSLSHGPVQAFNRRRVEHRSSS